ncbi:Hypothetical predicted protein [Cloeon dipterum]|uniref:Uncharacterized protein n=1 Tax=Cloeon dipterum TaxID=197152 RepID=A0A8S1D033_9INSE|nr:Hypothetical predicted protein [Cloeon dipterum]
MSRSKGDAKEFAAEHGPVELKDDLFSFGDLKGIKRLALVRIASKTDKVHWRWTQCKLLEAFADLDIELAIYLQTRPREVHSLQGGARRGEEGAHTAPKATAAPSGPSAAHGAPVSAGEQADPNCAPAAIRARRDDTYDKSQMLVLLPEKPNNDADDGLRGLEWQGGAQKVTKATSASKAAGTDSPSSDDVLFSLDTPNITGRSIRRQRKYENYVDDDGDDDDFSSPTLTNFI